jgi:hypothetical protein
MLTVFLDNLKTVCKLEGIISIVSQKQFKNTVYGLIAFLLMFAISAMFISGAHSARKAIQKQSIAVERPA